MHGIICVIEKWLKRFVGLYIVVQMHVNKILIFENVLQNETVYVDKRDTPHAVQKNNGY